tara:strand:- start:9839 stop:10402 length:564 start_codon:yes stop_codon:yes gene_type:complete
MKTKKKNSYHHGSLKQEILSAASDIIAKRGAVDFSIRDISTICKVSPSAIYKHFKSRNEIAVTLALEGMNILKSKFDELTASETDLIQYGETYIAFAIDYEGYFRAMYFSQLSEMDEYSHIESVSEQLNNHILSKLDKQLSTKNETHILRRLLVCVHGIAFLSIDNCTTFDKSSIKQILHDNLGDLI